MCCSKNFIKRILPFFLTFAVGLFVASFFITIAAPTLRISLRGNRNWREHQQQDRLMELENQRLRDDKARLQKQLADRDDASDSLIEGEDVFAAPLPPPPAPLKTVRK